MRITLYDPRVSAAAYSQRRAAEEESGSGIATGLARLGRALSEREAGIRRAGAGSMAVREAIGFWDDEVQRLDQLGAKIPPGKPGFHELAMKKHLAGRIRAPDRRCPQDVSISPRSGSNFPLLVRSWSVPESSELSRPAGRWG